MPLHHKQSLFLATDDLTNPSTPPAHLPQHVCCWDMMGLDLGPLTHTFLHLPNSLYKNFT